MALRGLAYLSLVSTFLFTLACNPPRTTRVTGMGAALLSDSAPQWLTTAPGTALRVRVSAQAQVVQAPRNGLLIGTPPNWTYVPGAGFQGTDTFSYTSHDASSALQSTPVSTVTVQVGSPSAALPPNATIPTPPAIPPHVQYAGFYLAVPLAQAQWSRAAYGTILDELGGQGNVVIVTYLPKEVLPAGTDPDELFISRIADARAHGYKVVLEITSIFFDATPTGSKLDRLSADSTTRWAAFKQLITPYLDSIVALYPLDEPFWQASLQNVSIATMKRHLEQISATIKADFPQIPLALIEAYTLVADMPMPSGFDWIGMDCYGSFDRCGQTGSNPGLSIPEYYAILKSKMTANQRLIAVPDAFLYPGDTDQSALLTRVTKFLNWVATEPKVIAVTPFLYSYPSALGERLTATRDIAPVREYYKKYLTQMRSQGGATSFTQITNLEYPGALGPQKFDLYLPLDYQTKSYPVYVWIHGGGWSDGDKSAEIPLAQAIAAAGYIVANINYTLVSGASSVLPAGLNDVNAFIAYLKANLSAINADNLTAVSIGGGSAGAHLALMQAVSPSSPLAFRCVADLAGPTDLTASNLSSYSVPLLNHALTGSASTSPSLAAKQSLSPLNFASRFNATSAYLVHADGDTLVPFDQSTRMEAALRAIGVSVSTQYLPFNPPLNSSGGSHGFTYEDVKPGLSNFVASDNCRRKWPTPPVPRLSPSPSPSPSPVPSLGPSPLPLPVLTISCPAQVAAGSSGTCNATSTGPLASGYWTVNGVKQDGSDNLYSYTWPNIAYPGTYEIQGIATDPRGNTIRSNIVRVTVTPPTLTISCPSSLYVGESGTCTSSATAPLAAGYWTVDGTQQQGVCNVNSCTWSNVSTAGTYSIQEVAQDLSGNTIRSNAVSVTVKRPTLSISCPSGAKAGSSITCTAKIAGTLSTGYWMVNGVKQAGSVNMPTYTWYQVPAGTYLVQGTGTDPSGAQILSNTMTVRVVP